MNLIWASLKPTTSSRFPLQIPSESPCAIKPSPFTSCHANANLWSSLMRVTGSAPDPLNVAPWRQAVSSPPPSTGVCALKRGANSVHVWKCTLSHRWVMRRSKCHLEAVWKTVVEVVPGGSLSNISFHRWLQKKSHSPPPQPRFILYRPKDEGLLQMKSYLILRT